MKFAQHLYLNRISDSHDGMCRHSITRELDEMGNREKDKKIKMHRKMCIDAHFSVHGFEGKPLCCQETFKQAQNMVLPKLSVSNF